MLWLADRLWPLPLAPAPGARVVLARDGTPLWRFADQNGVWRYPVTLADVSPRYLDALLAYEDRWFYRHLGINPLALLRAATQNLGSGRIVSGGSTLTMQVARLIEPHERTLTGKLRQMARTLQLEWHLSKDEILTLYLNRAPFGGTLEGVAAASWTLLGKSPMQLTHAEAALLAVLPQAPSRLRPDRHPERARAARDKVLERLRSQDTWPATIIDDALAENVLLAPAAPPGLAPLLARRVASSRAADDRIATTLDAALQRRLEGFAREQRRRLPPRTSLAIVVAEVDDMAVRAYLGSLDFNDASRFGHVDMVRALRSPGSALKPFLSGMALDAGLIHSESLLQDVPRAHARYRPGNFGTDFSGPVSASQALAQSLNLPFVQLLEAFGPRRFVAALARARMPLVVPDGPPNLAVILGGGGSRLEDLLAGDRALARGGRSLRPHWLADAPDHDERPLLSPAAAWIVAATLRGERAGGLALPREYAAPAGLAWKTGTSYGFRDAWALGVDSRYVIGVWVGRPDGAPVAEQSGTSAATPLLFAVHDIVRHGLGAAPAWPAPPQAVVTRTICWPGGQPPADTNDASCRQRRQAWTLAGLTPPTLPLTADPASGAQTLTLWLDTSGARVAPYCNDARPQRLTLWPAALETWLPADERRVSRLPPLSRTCPPPGQNLAMPPLRIENLRDGDLLQSVAGHADQPLTLSLHATGGHGTRWWFLNGKPLGTTQGAAPLTFTLSQAGAQTLSVVDEGGEVARVGFVVRRR